MHKVTVDTIKRVWDDQEGLALDIGPDADALGVIWLRNKDKKSAEFWGEVDFTLSTEMARAVGQAMIEAADALDATEARDK